VPNGADYVVPARSRSAEDTIPRILYLANLQSSKGILDLLEAITILQNRIKTPFSVDVVGDWRDIETKRTATEIVQRFGSPVRFHPPAVADAKMQYMADADIFVFPPRAPEGHPWVIVEAQAAGLPIVATPQGAIPEAVEDGKCGFIVPAADPAAIAEKLERLILDATMRRVFGDRSLAIYHDRYTEAAMVDRFASVIRAAIGGTVHTK
jgi:glycosyltransferase involved in cell wall biosynthesis